MSRRDIYYWKCDRPAAFHGTGPRPRGDEVSEEKIRVALAEYFGSRLPVAEPATVPTNGEEPCLRQTIANGAESPPSERSHVPLPIQLSPGAGQGNHLTWNAEIDGAPAFLRIENGPEGDDHLEMESVVLGEVAKSGVPVPRVLGCDASRTRVPFAWQALERIPHPDLNQWWKAGSLDEAKVAYEIGQNVARWQAIKPKGFGPFDPEAWRGGKGPVGFHPDYPTYYHLRLEDHLRFLVTRSFFSNERADEIRALIEAHAGLLQLDHGVLVHKDLALWNVLGTPDSVVAFIDFDDAISGDPMDDLSLLACFHDRVFLKHAFAGYASGRPFPDDWRPRFWLHLLRNLIVKAVIRVGAGYFQRDSGFFLIGSGGSGADLRRFTEERIDLAMRGLREGSGLEIFE
ncbi:MAG: aminoglycoside phosphotransferase family protein [Verrucomicrobiales bacterium]|nr:aminoglycoside phosphotransferase family protein [Verrucomicrobiales bacterium]